MSCPKLYGQHKKNPYGRKYKVLSDILTSFFKRSQFCFGLNAFVVVETYVFTYEEASLLIGAEFYAVDALGFENGEEIFRHCIVIRIAPT